MIQSYCLSVCLPLGGWRWKPCFLPSPGEKDQGVTHVVILRARPGSRTFFYPSGQSLVIWLHLPAKGVEKALRSTAKSTFRVERRLNNGGGQQCATLWEAVSGVCSSYQESWKGTQVQSQNLRRLPETRIHIAVWWSGERIAQKLGSQVEPRCWREYE